MSNGEQTTGNTKQPELHTLYRPLGIRAVEAAAIMLKSKKPTAKPA